MSKLYKLYELLMEVKKIIYWQYKDADQDYYNKLNRNLQNVINLVKEKRVLK